MARPIWNGTISFGLLNVPVQLYSGERSVDLHKDKKGGAARAPARKSAVHEKRARRTRRRA